MLSEPPLIGRVVTRLMAQMTKDERDKALEEWLGSEPASPFALERLLECDIEEDETTQSDFEKLHTEDLSTDNNDLLAPIVAVYQQAPDEGPENKIRSPSKQIHQKAIKKATVIFIDIQGFTAVCAKMDVAAVGKWVQDIYDHVEHLCYTHNVLLVELRDDCCVCVDGSSGNAGICSGPSPHPHPPTHGPVRIGMSTRGVHFLYRENFRCVYGRTPKAADQLQAMANPGKVLLNAPAIEEWAEETQSKIPPVHLVHFTPTLGGRIQRGRRGKI